MLRINGMIPSADVWLNGNLVADQAAIAGAYPVHELDVTRWVHAGTNTLALRVHPGDPRTSLSIGWVDWNPTPPDNNMGPWRGVDIVRTGPVEIRFPQVTSTLSLPDLARAALTVKVEARNLDASAHDATITGVVAGVSLRRTIHLAPGETQTVSFSPKSDPGLDLKHPQVWWPVGMGAHPLYTFGDERLPLMVRSPTGPARRSAYAASAPTSPSRVIIQFVINGKPVLIRGAGWAPDMFLRDDPKRMEAEFSYVVNLGLNTIRSEGKLEDARFYDLADRDGIMILAGWECCDKWESCGQDGRRAVGRCGREGGRSLDGERGASAAEPPVRDRISDRQRQRAAGGDREDVRRYLACRRLAAADHRGGSTPGHGRDRTVRHEDGRALLVGSAGVLVCRQAGRRVRVRLRSQRRRHLFRCWTT